MSKEHKHRTQPAGKEAKPIVEDNIQAKSTGPHVESDETQAVMRKADPGLGAQMIQRMQQAGGNQAVVQAKQEAAAETEIQSTAAAGVAGSGSTMPHAETIQKAFGKHDISHVEAHVGGKAAEASRDIGARAYATGNKVAFANQPDLHTAAHEAAHVVQQQAGVSLKGGVGQVGDKYEQHADAVADLVVQGKSAEGELDKMTGSQSKPQVQRKEANEMAKTSAVELSDNEKLALANQIRDQIPFACDAYMKACRDEEKSLTAAAKKKTDIASLALDGVMAMVPLSIGESAKQALLGVSSKLQEEALAKAVKAAENSVRGGLVRNAMSGASKGLKKSLEVAVNSSDPVNYCSTLEAQAPLAFANQAQAITKELSTTALLGHAGYWFADAPKNPATYAPIIKHWSKCLQILVDAIDTPGLDWSFNTEANHLVYCVDRTGKPKKNPCGTDMAIVDFYKGDNTTVVWFVEPGLESGVLAKQWSAYGRAPEKFVCEGDRATRWRPNKK